MSTTVAISVALPLRPSQVAMDTLHAVSTEELVRVIRLAPPKSSYLLSPLDCTPTSLLKEAAEVMAPLLAKLANMSFTTGVFAARYKLGHVIPLLNKSGLPKNDPANNTGQSLICRPSPNFWSGLH